MPYTLTPPNRPAPVFQIHPINMEKPMRKKMLHIIITGESGKGCTLCIPEKNIINTFLSTVIIITFFSAAALFSINHYKNDNLALQNHIAALTNTMEKTDRLKNERADWQVELNCYKEQVKNLQQEKTEMLASTISRLNERSAMIKKVMHEVGVVIEVEEDPQRSGGRYIAIEDAPDKDISEALLLKADRYLELFNYVPLSRPLASMRITSKYGPRIDPFKKTKAFHGGIDFGGRTGDNIYVTGNGVVKTSAIGKGFGNFIVIDHGHGYRTLYAHLSKRLVKRGDKVSRGQVIGLLGNTGRSTGPHLHYEIHKNKKTVNPMKYLQAVNVISARKTH